MLRSLLDYLPPWLLLSITVLLLAGGMWGGYRLAVRRRTNSEIDVGGPNDTVLSGTVGLLALLMAFTFGMAAARFDARRQLLLDEVNAIGTLYLRAELIAEPESLEIRRLIQQYVRIRADLAANPQLISTAIAQSDALHDQMWSQATRAAKKDSKSEIVAMFIDSLNQVIDFHSQRVVVNQYRISGVIWFALYLVTILTMTGIGYQLGRAGARDVAISAMFVLCVSIVIYLIADLDHGYEGNIQVDQKPILELHHKLNGSGR